MNRAQAPLDLLMRCAAVTSFALVAPALAQVASVTPYYAIVTSEKAVLRAADIETVYIVATAERGTLLLVDGEGNGWARVSYPAGSSCFVTADAATLDSATGSVRLSKPNRLKAASLSGGIDKSWKFALSKELPEGSVLKHMETLTEKTGGESRVVGYRVAAPEAARAFTELRSVRRATADEVNAMKAKPGAYVPEGGTTAAPAAPTATTKPAEKAPEKATEKPTEKVDNSLVKPAVPGSTTAAPSNPVTSPDAAPAVVPSPAAATTPAPTANPTDTVTPGATPSTTPATTPNMTPGGSAPVAEAPEIKPREVPEPTGPTAESLEPTFQRLWKQGGSSEEYAELITQYKGLLAAMGDDGFGQRRRKQIQSRIDVLTIKLNTQQSVSEAQEGVRKVEAANAQVQQTLSAVDAARVYATVGTLTTSTVYNGTNLPLMYRVQANDGTGRTLGYIKPTALPNLAGLVGKTVGVVGDAALDETLKLRVINAIRVDPITIVPVTAPAAAPAPAPAAAAPTK